MPLTCEEQCAADYYAAEATEWTRYQNARAACNGDTACLAAVAAEHNAISQQISADYAHCLWLCAHHGAGRG